MRVAWRDGRGREGEGAGLGKWVEGEGTKGEQIWQDEGEGREEGTETQFVGVHEGGETGLRPRLTVVAGAAVRWRRGALFPD